MAIEEEIFTLIKSVESNAHASEPPQEPTFPLAVFDIDVQPERNWVFGADYAQYLVTVYLFDQSKSALMSKVQSMRAAFNLDAKFLHEEESGDAQFEEWPNVFSYFMNFRLRGHLS